MVWCATVSGWANRVLLRTNEKTHMPSPTHHPCLTPCSYLAVSCASVHLSSNQPHAALALYQALGPCLSRLPVAHPNTLIVLSCRGYALHAAGQLREAFEQLVQVRVCHVFVCVYVCVC